MHSYSYYPFINSLEVINHEDLVKLHDIAEGWYIDYKSQGLNISDYAKHLCSFANQYGGWLIIGVTEKSDGSRTADKFLGVDNELIAKISIDVREAAAAHSNPPVLYEEKIVKGPISEIDLPEEKSIIIFGIPMSKNTPHIHSSGRIYRRLADQSKPKEETDRFILDELWRRGKEFEKALLNFSFQTPKLPPTQNNSSWIYIYLIPDHSSSKPEAKLEFDDFKKIATNKHNEVYGVNVPMDSVYTTTDGFIARHINSNYPGNATLTLRWWHDGRCRFEIPLNTFNKENFILNSSKNKSTEQFIQCINDHGFENEIIVDYSLLIQTIAAMSNFYVHLTNITKDQRYILSSFKIINVLNTIPFVDSLSYIGRINEQHVPLTLDETISYPSELTFENMIFHDKDFRYEQYDKTKQLQLAPYVFSGPIIRNVLFSVGVISTPEQLIDDEEIWAFDKISNSSSDS